MSNNNTHTFGEAPWLHIVISTGFGTGFFPYGPGTAGAFVALLIWIGLYYLLSPMMLAIATALLIVGSLLIGVWTDNVMEKYWGADPRAVVIDEYFGTWMAVTATLFVDGSPWDTIGLAFLAFVLFRIIDITKPLGCRWVDTHIHGGWGCMLDDALAGFYAMFITIIVRIIAQSALIDLWNTHKLYQ